MSTYKPKYKVSRNAAEEGRGFRLLRRANEYFNRIKKDPRYNYNLYRNMGNRWEKIE